MAENIFRGLSNNFYPYFFLVLACPIHKFASAPRLRKSSDKNYLRAFGKYFKPFRLLKYSVLTARALFTLFTGNEVIKVVRQLMTMAKILEIVRVESSVDYFFQSG